MYNSYKFNRVLKFPGYNDPFTIAAVAVGVSAVSAYMQYESAQDAADAQKEAAAAQGRSAAVEAQQARIKQVREARIRRAQVISSGTNSGMGMGSSGIGGAVGSISSQMGSNIGTINQQQTFAQETSAALQKAADANVTAQGWQMIGNFSQSAFNQAGGFTTIFGGNTNKGVG